MDMSNNTTTGLGLASDPAKNATHALFLHWLSLPETQSNVMNFMNGNYDNIQCDNVKMLEMDKENIAAQLWPQFASTSQSGTKAHQAFGFEPKIACHSPKHLNVDEIDARMHMSPDALLPLSPRAHMQSAATACSSPGKHISSPPPKSPNKPSASLSPKMQGKQLLFSSPTKEAAAASTNRLASVRQVLVFEDNEAQSSSPNAQESIQSSKQPSMLSSRRTLGPISQQQAAATQLAAATAQAFPNLMSPTPSPAASCHQSYSQIPRFYFPKSSAGSRPVTEDDVRRERVSIKEAFLRSSLHGLTPDEFEQAFSKMRSDLPSFLHSTLFLRIDTKNKGRVTLEMFEKYWNSNQMFHKTSAERLFQVLKSPGSGDGYITPSDIRPLLEELLLSHPGLQFLHHNERIFQIKYMQTVIIRIFYTVNKGCNGRISWKEFEQSALPEALFMLDRDGDINKETNFFSYEHFYVIYCKFWELDEDHDFLLSKANLLPYNNYALNPLVIDRIFAGYGKRLTGKRPNTMSYEDFVWFYLSEEDKSMPAALLYWFQCCDLDSDGVVTPEDMQYFFRNQTERLQSISIESMQFKDLYAQVIDLVKPSDPSRIRLQDIKRSKSSCIFFNVLFNLSKLVAFDQGTYRGQDDWAAFAALEYRALADGQSDETDDMIIESADDIL